MQNKFVSLPDAERIPALGQGTWRMGENKNARPVEVAALRLGIDLGMTLIDTAEMYAEGGAEEVVAAAIDGQRERVFLVSKVYPHHGSRTELPKACERSLKRLRTETIDLYLLHWQSGDIPLPETIEVFEQLRVSGKIRRWGVSNFDITEMEELLTLSDGPQCAANQVLYHVGERGIEFDLLPWTRQHRIPIMAYAPVGHGRGLLNHAVLKKIAGRHAATPAQIALAWVLRQPGITAIPKASTEAHVRDNAASLDIELSQQDLIDLDHALPPPKEKRPLAIL